MKKVLILSTSPRKNGNSARLAQEFEKGATSASNECEIIYLCEKNINYCKGCFGCFKNHKCIINDDMNDILDKMKKSDVIVFATPVYYYEMSGQMKTFIDRTNPLFQANYSFTDIYLLMSAADGDERPMKRVVSGLEGWIECYSKTRLKGVVKALNVTNAGDIENHVALREAYNFGKNV